MGFWYWELKDIFMYGRSNWGDVKIVVICVFYFGGLNFVITIRGIGFIEIFGGKSFRIGGLWFWFGFFDEGYCLILLIYLFMIVCCGFILVFIGYISFVVRIGEKWYLV